MEEIFSFYDSSSKSPEVHIPTADKKQLVKNTQEAPVWIHFGGGNLYRGFHGKIAQDLIEAGELTSGVIVCETFDEGIVDDCYQPYNNDFAQVIMHESGDLDVNLINATAASYYCHPNRSESFAKVLQIFQQPSVQFVTLTITEKGYNIRDSAGNYAPIVQQDLANGPENPQHTVSILTALLYARFKQGKLPIAMVSTDNFSQNGQKFQTSVLAIAEGWQQAGWVEAGFIDYLSNDQLVSFPWTMIDRITPNPSEAVKEKLEAIGFSEVDLIQTAKHTNIALFANTEATHYLVIEDAFPNGRPALEKAGVILTDRETVDKVDTMKVTACLNPLHTALAIFGCLLGKMSIAEEMRDKALVKLIEGIGYREGLPVVADPGIIDPKQFIDEVIHTRLVNPMIPDTPQRIAADTSQKIGIRYGETIKKYVALPDKSVEELHYIPLTIAGWLRYLLAVDDRGEAFTPSPDPLLDELQEQLARVTIGFTGDVRPAVRPILRNTQIFGSDLYEIGLGEKVEQYFKEMLQGPGAVRATVEKYV
ncbi:mannitol dehydrogenase family protein [Candidatus Enterococcus clewellii]|uniref:Fructuronate reductase n=1 Tax=Candidatus Enterococcus clewellii TaxID=1834193 RepID=A0A242K8X7_9ENTE|nr:mannitol dehydrogenase family protein [Enterococcus sp. 9E7_DIV0242]OTP17621.1 hypothetical protein A5888_001759 [Enterococcus sp. 9E7_DIV0242]